MLSVNASFNRHVIIVFQTNCAEFESRLNSECDAIVSAVRRRQQELIENARREASFKQQSYCDQVTQCTSRVHRTTGLLQYSVEVMKEADQTAFLQVTKRRVKICACVKLAFHGADTDTDTDFLADILARIVARMSACR